MDNNYILRSLRYSFDFGDDKMMEIFGFGGKEVNRAELSNWLKREDDPEFKPIYDVDLAAFLNGLIILNRGQKDGQTPKPEKSLNNNQIFRKLKIALSFKDEDILERLALAGMNFGKHELSAIFRNPSQSQYRPCKDQVLRNFLKGLSLSLRLE